MTDSEVGDVKLPPFSFTKKPVTSIHPSPHSAISDIIPNSSVVRGAGEGNSSLIPPSDITTNPSLYNNIDYDEQIRAPRMNNINYYTYNTARQQTGERGGSTVSGVGSGSISSSRKDSGESKDNSSTPSTTANTSPSNDAKTLGNRDSDENYLPANFDLNQPIRRFSTASNNTTSESPKTAILNYTTNNYIYERNQGPRKVFEDGLEPAQRDSQSQLLQHQSQEHQNQHQQEQHQNQQHQNQHQQQHQQQDRHQQHSHSHQQEQQPDAGAEEAINKDKLLKALENLKNNTTTRERQRSTASNSSTGSNGSQNSTRIKNRTSNMPYNNHLLNRNGTELQQVYELKKPLCTPAVLRPIVTGSNSSNNVNTGNSLTPTSSATATPGEVLNSLSTMDLITPNQTGTSTPGNTSSDGAEPNGSPTTPYVDIKAFPFSQSNGLTSISPTLRVDPQRTETFTQTTTKLDLSTQPVEPTHEHWKPNNFTSHCMKCVGAFGNFFTPQRKRRHHCRFCGLIFCFDCLWQLDVDSANTTGGGVGSNIASNRLTRSVSNSSMQVRSTTSRADGNNYNKNSQALSQSNPTAVPSAANDSVGGVLMDSEARFVIPIFQEVQKQALSIQFEDHFKFCKVCKDCGNKYQNLIGELNSGEEVKDAPFLFIENPYLQQTRKTTSGGGNNMYSNFESRQKLIERGRQMSGINESDLPAGEFDGVQKSQTSNVPSDWSWSSF
ncbi:hypothetical protein CLIB1423_07S03576 [[Candida] railenensis]|uniref:FYVE-type domain-containing protein n=1 Tax=[Candida] railenensis TaxID=45579 RepID=A0A9P0VYL2_9ASCO|nr:hypothetical protein CLIB1423_07S03576 [[Candida] railenensis]